MSITPSISELLRLLSSFSLPITVTFILVCVTSALYFEERPLTLNESTVKVFLDRPLRSSTSFADVEATISVLPEKTVNVIPEFITNPKVLI